MTYVTTPTVSGGKLKLWGPLEKDTGVPRGEVLFAGTQLIPGKGALDRSLWTLQCNFPRNWLFRIVECRLWAVGPQADGMDKFANGITCLVSSDAEPDWYFVAQNNTLLIPGTTSYPYTLQFAFNGALGDTMMFFQPSQAVDAIISTAKGSARLFFRWLNITGDITNDVTAFFRIRALMYDVVQDLNWPMHSPGPVIGA